MNAIEAGRAAEKHWAIFSVIAENYSHEMAKREAVRAFLAGATFGSNSNARELSDLRSALGALYRAADALSIIDHDSEDTTATVGYTELLSLFAFKKQAGEALK